MKLISNIRRFFVLVLLLTPLLGAHAANPESWWVDIKNDRAENVSAMLAQGADPNEISPAGQPAIMQAIRDGAWQVYDVLLVNPKTVFNAINVNHETPLLYLAVIGDTQRAEDLIRRGGLVNRKGWTALHYAASTGKIETATMLLQQGAQVNAPAPDGTTPLMMAAYGGSEAMVRLLLQAGADAHIRNRQDYDAADWAGFKANTTLAGKLRVLIDAPPGKATSTVAGADVFAPLLDQDSQKKATDLEAATSSSRYFDLDRFNEPSTP